MKVNSWFTLLYVGSYFISVSPKLSQTTTTSTTPTTATSIAKITTQSSNYYSQHYKRSIYAEPTPTDMPAFCNKFIYPAENRTFFSPMDPTSSKNFYPSHASCEFVLEAPQGHVLRLDFRNKFHIEPSTTDNCDYDYLEIRDGKHGYSKVIGKFCGTDFPPMIHSSDRYLWLQFKSDDNIEYDGFQAVFDYIPRPTSSLFEETLCVFDLTGPEGFINRTDIDERIIQIINENPTLTLDCLWTITVDENWKILLTFSDFQLIKKNDCESNVIEIFGAKTRIADRIKDFCGVVAEPVISKTNILHVRFYAEKIALGSNFTILYTAYREKINKKDCSEDEFDCDDDTCIAIGLECNGRSNCKLNKDENDCGGEVADNKDHLVIIIVVFTLILGAMTTAFLVSCIRKLIRDQQIIREHIRQSKESKLDEAGRISLKLSRDDVNKITTPRKQLSLSQQRSIHILDDDSNKYYRDTVAMSIGFREDIKNGHNYRNQEMKDVLDLSLHKSEKSSQEGFMCDMACQTRESLFAPVFKNKITQSPSQPSNSALRFSTFGYDSPSRESSGGGGGGVGGYLGGSKTLTRQSTNTKDKSHTTVATTEIQMDDLGPSKDFSKHHHHHHHLHHHNDPINHKKNPKMEETRAYLDIRNSAPDVIIMTSH